MNNQNSTSENMTCGPFQTMKNSDLVSHHTAPGLPSSGNDCTKTFESKKHLAAVAVRAYDRAGKQSEEDLITQYLPLVHKIVNKVASYLKAPLTKEDLVSAGCIGLIKAAQAYDPYKDADFKTYAYIRIRGAVIDELRSWTFTPSKVNKKIHELEAACHELHLELGTFPDDNQIAQRMDISVDELYKLYDSSRGQSFLSLDRQSDDGFSFADTMKSDIDSPSHRLDKEELVSQLTHAVLELPEKQRQIIVLYYQQELTMKEVANVLDITESRVSQLHSSAIFRLQVKMKEFNDSF